MPDSAHAPRLSDFPPRHLSCNGCGTKRALLICTNERTTQAWRYFPNSFSKHATRTKGKTTKTCELNELIRYPSQPPLRQFSFSQLCGNWISLVYHQIRPMGKFKPAIGRFFCLPFLSNSLSCVSKVMVKTLPQHTDTHRQQQSITRTFFPSACTSQGTAWSTVCSASEETLQERGSTCLGHSC